MVLAGACIYVCFCMNGVSKLRLSVQMHPPFCVHTNARTQVSSSIALDLIAFHGMKLVGSSGLCLLVLELQA